MADDAVPSIFTPDGPQACYWPVSLETYHKRDEIVGHGMVDEFRDSPRTYEKRRVLHTLPPKPWSDDLRVGTALHDLMFDPAKLSKWEVGKWTPSERKSGAKRLLPDEKAAVLAWGKSLLESQATGPWLRAAGAIYERPIVWRDEETGLVCKCCPDVWIPQTPEGGRAIINLKSAKDARPHAFRYAIEDYGYHRGAAWYLAGEAALHGEGSCVHLWAVVDKGNLATAMYEIGAEDIEKARAQNRRALNRMAECYRTGVFRARFEQQITRLSLANHAFNEDDYELF